MELKVENMQFKLVNMRLKLTSSRNRFVDREICYFFLHYEHIVD